MNHIAIFDGDKGGVGKSFACRCYIDLLLSRKNPPLQVSPIDCDPRNPDIYRTFARDCQVAKIFLGDEEGWAKLFKYITEAKEKNFAISLPAGIGVMADQWAAIFKKSLAQSDNSILTFWVMGKDADSRNLFKTAIAKGSIIADRTVVILNNFFNETAGSDVYYEWRMSQIRRKFLDKGGKEIILPKLATRIVQSLDYINEANEPAIVPFHQSNEVFKNNAFDKNVISNWMEEVEKVFAPILENESLFSYTSDITTNEKEKKKKE